MIPLTLREVAAVTGADVVGAGAVEATVTSVEFDSRRIRPGALFVALRGDHADGHDFAAAAARSGAVAVLGSRSVPELPTLVVPGGDVLAALAALAAHVARRLSASGLTIIGVTGSAGKTSTKDLLASVLAQAGTVVAPPGSFNNELGHPYTVLQADEGTDFLVLELSARGIGHIAALADIAPPRIGAVLNVGSAHLGEFGDQQAIATAKGELVEALPATGVAVLNADDPLVAAMASRTAAQVVRVGLGETADVRALNVTLDGGARARFTLQSGGASAPVHLSVVGAHQVSNALAAAAIALTIGMDIAAVATALSAAGPQSRWRMAVTKVPGGVTVVNDAYNANPESTTAALDALSAIGGEHRRWAVLGELAELGEHADEAHRRIGEAAVRGGALLVVVGEAARPMAEAGARVAADTGAPEPQWVADRDEALRILLQQVEPPDVVLVKASRSAGLERVALGLIDGLPSRLVGGAGPDGPREQERA